MTKHTREDCKKRRTPEQAAVIVAGQQTSSIKKDLGVRMVAPLPVHLANKDRTVHRPHTGNQAHLHQTLRGEDSSTSSLGQTGLV